ncbi:MAG TPA: hypothetical protein VJ779_12290, partial [Acetobacteraceae bacterium]|nr:hypothetical protein [Acetobacteraceae bacterium]
MLTGEIDILPSLFGSVAIPNAVQAEMLHSEAPRVVRSWAEAPPPWLTIAPARIEGDAENPRRGAGERAVIALALATGAEL